VGNINLKLIQKLKILIIGAGLLLPLIPQTAYAASASVRLSPASGNVAKGSVITIGIRENSGSQAVNAAAVTVSYPAAQFDFVSISNSSAFGVVAANSGGGGSVHVERGALPAVSGDQLIASFSLRAKVNSGTATLSIPSADIRSASDNSSITGAVSGGTYTLTNAPTPAAAAPKDTTPPAISNVKATNVYTNYALITWTTSEPSTSEVMYGPNAGYGIAAADQAMVTAHSVKLTSPLLTGGNTYHFMVRSVDPSGNAATGNDGTFKTRGGTLVITVLNQSNKGVSGADVSVAGVKGTTDKKGQVKLKDVTYGEQAITVTYHHKDSVFKKNVEVLEGPDDVQPITLKIQASSNTLWVILALLLAGLTVFLLMRRGGGPGSGLRRRLAGAQPGGGGSGGSGSAQTPGGPATTTQAPPSVVKPSNK
jgi:hypothetical protein